MNMNSFITVNSLVDSVFLNFVVFSLAFFSAMLYSSNFIRLLINIELMILAVNLNFIIFSFLLDDILGQVFVIFILAIVAAESAIGLAIFILYYRSYKTISVYSLDVDNDPN